MQREPDQEARALMVIEPEVPATRQDRAQPVGHGVDRGKRLLDVRPLDEIVGIEEHDEVGTGVLHEQIAPGNEPHVANTDETKLAPRRHVVQNTALAGIGRSSSSNEDFADGNGLALDGRDGAYGEIRIVLGAHENGDVRALIPRRGDWLREHARCQTVISGGVPHRARQLACMLLRRAKGRSIVVAPVGQDARYALCSMRCLLKSALVAHGRREELRHR